MPPSDSITTWLRGAQQATNGSPRLICFPHAGGAASYYRPVSVALSPGVDVLAVQYPGRQDRRAEPLVDDLEVLADRIAPVVAELADRPLAFFGHSMGASVAFEVARRLERDGVHLLTLFVSGRRAPSADRDERVHLGGDAALLAEMRRLSGTEARLLDDEEIVRMVLPAIRNDYRAAETYRYRPGPDLTCPLVALLGEDDPKVTVAEAQRWEQHTSGSFDLTVYPGGHFYLTDHAAAVNRLLADRITQLVTTP